MPIWTKNPRAKRYPSTAKRGFCWQFKGAEIRSLTQLNQVAWWYNWNLLSTRAGFPAAGLIAGMQGVEFVPMIWGRWLTTVVPQVIQPGAKVLLTQNEPNHRMHANMTPWEVMVRWGYYELAAKKHGLRLGSPSPAPCGAKCIPGYRNPLDWYDRFFYLCDNRRIQGKSKPCQVDFIAAHYYVCNLRGMIAYLEQLHTRYRKPVWLTEFACPLQDSTYTRDFLRQFIEWADAPERGWLERYAWFGVSVLGASKYSWIWLGPGVSLVNPRDPTTVWGLGRDYNSRTARSWQGGRSSTPFSAAALDMAPGPASEQNGTDPANAWSVMCGECAALPDGEAAPADMQEHCQWNCGFWEVELQPAPDYET